MAINIFFCFTIVLLRLEKTAKIQSNNQPIPTILTKPCPSGYQGTFTLSFQSETRMPYQSKYPSHLLFFFCIEKQSCMNWISFKKHILCAHIALHSLTSIQFLVPDQNQSTVKTSDIKNVSIFLASGCKFDLPWLALFGNVTQPQSLLCNFLVDILPHSFHIKVLVYWIIYFSIY